jgi:phosphatidylcholine synthase
VRAAKDNDQAGNTRSAAVTWPAWLVHAYTATGALLAFLAIQATVMRDFRAAFLWLFIAVLVDSTDGLLARSARVHERIPHFSGGKLDDIVDYLTFVFVPAVILWQTGAVTGLWATPVIAAMLLSSLFGFVSEDAKTEDHFFTGFPSYWNIVALYLVVLELSPVLNAIILLSLSALVFVRIGYVYPTRTTAARNVTLALGLLWSLMMLVLILQLPSRQTSIAWVSLFFPAYYTALSLVLQARRSRAARA